MHISWYGEDTERGERVEKGFERGMWAVVKGTGVLGRVGAWVLADRYWMCGLALMVDSVCCLARLLPADGMPHGCLHAAL